MNLDITFALVQKEALLKKNFVNELVLVYWIVPCQCYQFKIHYDTYQLKPSVVSYNWYNLLDNLLWNTFSINKISEKHYSDYITTQNLIFFVDGYFESLKNNDDVVNKYWSTLMVSPQIEQLTGIMYTEDELNGHPNSSQPRALI